MAILYPKANRLDLEPSKPKKAEILDWVWVSNFGGGAGEYAAITLRAYRRTSPTVRTLLGSVNVRCDLPIPWVLSGLPAFVGGNLEIELVIGPLGGGESNGGTWTWTLRKECWFKGGTITFNQNLGSFLYDDDWAGPTDTMFIGNILAVENDFDSIMVPGLSPNIVADVYEIKPKVFYTPPSLTGSLTDVLPTVSYQTNLTPIGQQWSYSVVNFAGLGTNALIEEDDDPHSVSFPITAKPIGIQSDIQIYGDDGTHPTFSLNAPFGIPAQTVTLGTAVQDAMDNNSTDWLFLGGITNLNTWDPNVTSIRFPLWPYEILPTSGVNPIFMGVM